MNFTRKMNNEDLINKITHLMQSDDSADAPEDAVRWSKNLFRSRAVKPKKSVVERMLAVLQIDLAPDKAAFGERSASVARARQMLFGAGANQIDLRIAPMNKAFRVTGQVLGAGFEGAEVKISDAEKTFTAKSNELSEFVFEKISKGTYTLTLQIRGKEIVIKNIVID